MSGTAFDIGRVPRILKVVSMSYLPMLRRISRRRPEGDGEGKSGGRVCVGNVCHVCATSVLCKLTAAGAIGLPRYAQVCTSMIFYIFCWHIHSTARNPKQSDDAGTPAHMHPHASWARVFRWSCSIGHLKVIFEDLEECLCGSRTFSRRSFSLGRT